MKNYIHNITSKLLFPLIFFGVAFLIPNAGYTQYILNGSAVKESCNCYLLTPAQIFKTGSVWQGTKINLENSFDFSFSVFLGCQDENGADGIAFILQPLSTSIGSTGGGLGFKGISPSIGVSLDTWQNIVNTENYNDPPYDHISIQSNGQIVHGNDLAGPIPASATSNNIEDCAWHILRITWDASSHTMNTYFDGVFRLSVQKDIVTTIFNNDPMVYWGFSAGTGDHYNVQKFCTASQAGVISGLSNDAICLGQPVAFKDSSISFATIKDYFWDFGDGSTSNLENPPPHIYSAPGQYLLKHVITGLDNCTSDTLNKIIKIGDYPNISFAIFDTCEFKQPHIDIVNNTKVGNINKWQWVVDGQPFSEIMTPDFSKLSPGNHLINLMGVTDIGCTSNTYNSNYTILPSPHLVINANDGCKNIPVLFEGLQTDKNTIISKWSWDFGDGDSSDQKNIQHAFLKPGTYPVKLNVTATNGCINDIDKEIYINEANANAGKDTIVVTNSPFQLNGSGGSVYTWSPTTGLDNPNISNPTGKVSNDITYHLTVQTTEGCVDTASVKVIVFKGSAIYVPTAFTPNGDNINDIIKPYCIGIKTLSYFTIYNRWGQQVFTTHDINIGWDGFFKNEIQKGVYVWVLKAVDIIGKKYDLRGSFILLK